MQKGRNVIVEGRDDTLARPRLEKIAVSNDGDAVFIFAKMYSFFEVDAVYAEVWRLRANINRAFHS